jgi:hypothetical protein
LAFSCANYASVPWAAGKLAPGEDAYNLPAATAIKQTEVEFIVSAFHPFLDQGLAALSKVRSQAINASLRSRQTETPGTLPWRTVSLSAGLTTRGSRSPDNTGPISE